MCVCAETKGGVRRIVLPGGKAVYVGVEVEREGLRLEKRAEESSEGQVT